MSKGNIIDITLKTSIKLGETVDEKWVDGLVNALEKDAEKHLDMGFSSEWNFREELEESE